ncbi:hypothetical protein C9439_00715 [archaeon SCG-AAA382B04]|nr:hypothetical protein C9439_00715 [archaeon SCG-AAA382B04]
MSQNTKNLIKLIASHNDMDPLDEEIFRIKKELENWGDYNSESSKYGSSSVYPQVESQTGYSKQWYEDFIQELDRSIERDKRRQSQLLNYMLGLLDDGSSRRRTRRTQADNDSGIESLFDSIEDYKTTKDKSDKEQEQYEKESFYNFVDEDLSLKEMKERNDFYDFVDEDLDMGQFKDHLD